MSFPNFGHPLLAFPCILPTFPYLAYSIENPFQTLPLESQTEASPLCEKPSPGAEWGVIESRLQRLHF
jgi:hypothetical protein